MFDASGFGLEVGPSYSPLLPKVDGFNVETIDHADAATLREKYKNNASKIEEVTYVSDGRSMLEIIGQPERYDFILASHVIEHVTDVVRFIQDCERLLKSDGRLVLAVPDKRYCFDAFRPVTTVGQALQAYSEKRLRHPAGVLFDHVAYLGVTPQSYVWKTQNLSDVALKNSSSSATKLFEAIRNGDASYHDAHAWQFTPASFRLLVKMLRDNGYIQSGVSELHTNHPPQTGLHEFYISLSRAAPPSKEPDTEILRQVEAELREVSFAAPEAAEKTAAGKQLPHRVDDLDPALSGGITRADFYKLIPSDKPLLEIGPFATPAFSGERVSYFDIMSAPEIRAECANLKLDASRVPQTIDFVERDTKLADIPRRFDSVFSSHCIEHTLDAYGHLREVSGILNPGGAYYLAIPDKRFIFDHFKDTTTLGSVVEAAELKPTDYSLKIWVDRVYIGTHNESRRHWAGDHGSQNKADLARRVKAAVEQYNSGYRYPMRPHIWTFTPSTFAEIMTVGCQLGYFDLDVSAVYKTRENANEFYAVLTKREA